MLQRTLKNGAEASVLGFGTMRLPVDENKAIMQERVQAMTDMAFEGGVNYFDTAYPYHDEKSEAAIGEALKKYDRESFMLADKLPVWLVEKEEDLETLFNTQLERTGAGYFDVYLLHALDKGRWDHVEKFKMFEFCQKKKEEGKIKRIGFSFHDDYKVLETIAKAKPWDIAQIQLNYLDKTLQHAEKQYEILVNEGIDVVVMEPIRGGFLANLPAEAHNSLAAARPDWTDAQWALRWVADHPGVKVILSGMSNEEQMAQNIATFEDDVEFTEADYAAVEGALDALNRMGAVPCTGCRYCMDCPFGVDIPRIFAIYNDYKRTGNGWVAKTNYLKDTPAENRADNCVQCGACMEQCPQHIQIPDKLAEIHAEILAIE